jgi:hypothetical protein
MISLFFFKRKRASILRKKTFQALALIIFLERNIKSFSNNLFFLLSKESYLIFSSKERNSLKRNLFDGWVEKKHTQLRVPIAEGLIFYDIITELSNLNVVQTELLIK